MNTNIYEVLMGGSAFVIAIQGSMLWATTISPESGLDKLRKARNILVPSYFVLALLSLVCCLTGYDRRIEPASTLFVGSFQALLFTMSMLVFIRPGEIRWRTVFRHAAVISVAGIALFVSLFCFTDYHSWFFYTGVIAYIGQMAFYTRKFMLAYRKTVQEVEDYYDDEEESRLRWVKVGFYSALTVGVLALPVLFYQGLYKYFVPLYVLFYSFMVMWFVNYQRRMEFVIPVIAESPQKGQTVADDGKTQVNAEDMEAAEDENGPAAENSSVDMEQMLHERLQQYIDRKEYCRKDVPSEEVATALGTTRPFLRKYMNDHYAMWFSTWRNDLRIHEACILWEKCPGISIKDMTQKTGYTNSGNFCRNFKKIVGVTPKEYCMQMHAKSKSGISPNPGANPL